jgi:uncharacterized protein (TIGR03435 family)
MGAALLAGVMASTAVAVGVVAPTDPDSPSLVTAVQEQLGLKLEPSRGPVEVLVIDRISRPAVD